MLDVTYIDTSPLSTTDDSTTTTRAQFHAIAATPTSRASAFTALKHRRHKALLRLGGTISLALVALIVAAVTWTTATSKSSTTSTDTGNALPTLPNTTRPAAFGGNASAGPGWSTDVFSPGNESTGAVVSTGEPPATFSPITSPPTPTTGSSSFEGTTSDTNSTQVTPTTTKSGGNKKDEYSILESAVLAVEVADESDDTTTPQTTPTAPVVPTPNPTLSQAASVPATEIPSTRPTTTPPTPSERTAAPSMVLNPTTTPPLSSTPSFGAPSTTPERTTPPPSTKPPPNPSTSLGSSTTAVARTTPSIRSTLAPTTTDSSGAPKLLSFVKVLITIFQKLAAAQEPTPPTALPSTPSPLVNDNPYNLQNSRLPTTAAASATHPSATQLNTAVPSTSVPVTYQPTTTQVSLPPVGPGLVRLRNACGGALAVWYRLSGPNTLDLPVDTNLDFPLFMVGNVGFRASEDKSIPVLTATTLQGVLQRDKRDWLDLRVTRQVGTGSVPFTIRIAVYPKDNDTCPTRRCTNEACVDMLTAHSLLGDKGCPTSSVEVSFC